MINLTTGHYIINYYGLGYVPLQSIQANARNLQSAKEEAQATIDNGAINNGARPHYYTIDRRIVNSTEENK